MSHCQELKKGLKQHTKYYLTKLFIEDWHFKWF